MSKTAIFWLLLFLPLSLNADWIDNLAAALEAYDKLTRPAPASSSLIADVAAEHGLPGHWQAYWLDEPVFGTRVFLAEAGKPGAPVMFLVHGLGQIGLRDWLPIVPALEEHYRVILIDLPGFANSLPPKAKLSPTRYADLLHFIKPYFTAEPVVVVGHSMGGAVTLRYAYRHPGDVSQIALLDAAGILQRTAFIKHSVSSRMPVDQQDVSGSLLAYVVGFQDYGNEIVERIAKWPDPTVWLGKSDYAWGAALGAYPNINAALALIVEDFSSAIFEQKKPVSILWGGEDSVAPLRTAHVLVQNLERGRLQVIPDAGHVPMASHPQEVSAWLLKSLEEAAELRQPGITNLHDGQPLYECNKQIGGVVSGAYSRIVIDECTGLVLDNVTSYEIVVRKSVVEFVNTEILNAMVALDIDDSTVVMTAGRVHGLIVVNRSRLDFAGVEFAQAVPFDISGESRLVISVSRAGKNRYLNSDHVLLDTQF